MQPIEIHNSPWEIPSNSQSARPSYKDLSISGFGIKAATPGDAQNIIDFYKKYPDPGLTMRDTENDPNTYRKYLINNPTTSFIAVKGDEIIATLLGDDAIGRGMFRHLLVAPEYRGFGIAKLLVDAGLNAFRELRVDLVQAIVRINNQPAKDFWERRGFRFSSTPDPSSSGKIVVMSIDLSVAKYIDRRDEFAFVRTSEFPSLETLK